MAGLWQLLQTAAAATVSLWQLSLPQEVSLLVAAGLFRCNMRKFRSRPSLLQMGWAKQQTTLLVVHHPAVGGRIGLVLHSALFSDKTIFRAMKYILNFTGYYRVERLPLLFMFLLSCTDLFSWTTNQMQMQILSNFQKTYHKLIFEASFVNVLCVAMPSKKLSRLKKK